MDWLNSLNESLNYLEEHMRGDISMEQAAKLACCSTYHFQRMFSYLAGVSLAEYIRRRRMTMAGFDLQNGARVLDTALCYGYGSPTSFNRAFRGIHGISPSAARKKGAKLKAYGKIGFKLTVRGEDELEYRIVSREAFRVMGWKTPLSRNMEENLQSIPEFWDKVMNKQAVSTSLDSLTQTPGQGILGVSVCMDDLEHWEYFIAVESGSPTPKGMDECSIRSGTWAVFSGKGELPEAVTELEQRAMTEWLPSSGFGYGSGPDMERYFNNDPKDARFELWLPVVSRLPE